MRARLLEPTGDAVESVLNPACEPFQRLVAPNELIILANLSAVQGRRGGLILTHKYLEGVAEFARFWPGRTTTLVRLGSRQSTDMDPVEIFPADLSFGLEVRPEGEERLEQRLAAAAVVLAFLSVAEVPTAVLCQRIGVPLVYYSEYSPRTEAQIINADTRNPLLRWRRKRWANGVERQRLAALPMAAGLQCSGAPTYEIYRHVNPHCMIFFDNRVREAGVLDSAGLERKARAVRRRDPLRLVFGGRLIAMKGVLDLPGVAHALQHRGVNFTLDIYGGGVLQAALEHRIHRFGLGDRVRLRGVLDFEREWIPRLKEQADLFVCCHPQGDPSSTYPEVMACGVPIAGYDNEAFAGLVQHAGCGWLSPVGDVEALAQVIARLDSARDELAEASARACDFARAHVFERTFARRTAHLLQLSRMALEPRSAALKQLEGIT